MLAEINRDLMARNRHEVMLSARQAFGEPPGAIRSDQSCECQGLGDEHCGGPLQPVVTASEPKNHVSDEINDCENRDPLDVMQHGATIGVRTSERNPTKVGG